MACLIHVLGWEGALPASPSWRFVTVRPCELPNLKGSLLLLGERALGWCTREAVREWRRGGCRRVLLALDSCEAERLDGWLEDGAIQLVPLHRLDEVLRELLAPSAGAGAPWPLEPRDWLAGCGIEPPATGTLAHELLSALENHRPLHRTREWARACGVDYDELRGEIREALDLTPSEAAQLFVLAQAERADAEGIDRFSTARMLGFAGESELAHCLRRGRRVRRLVRKRREPAAARPADTGTRQPPAAATSGKPIAKAAPFSPATGPDNTRR